MSHIDQSGHRVTDRLHKMYPGHEQELDRLMAKMDRWEQYAGRFPVDSLLAKTSWNAYDKVADAYDRRLARARRERDGLHAQADIDTTMGDLLYGGVG